MEDAYLDVSRRPCGRADARLRDGDRRIRRRRADDDLRRGPPGRGTAGARAADRGRLQRVRDRLLGRLSALRAAAAERPTQKPSATRSPTLREGASATCSPRASSLRAASAPSQSSSDATARTSCSRSPTPADVAQHVNDGELASLELSLIAPLPHVSVGVAGEVSATAAVAAGTRTVRTRDGGSADAARVHAARSAPGRRGRGSGGDRRAVLHHAPAGRLAV